MQLIDGVNTHGNVLVGRHGDELVGDRQGGKLSDSLVRTCPEGTDEPRHAGQQGTDEA